LRGHHVVVLRSTKIHQQQLYLDFSATCYHSKSQDFAVGAVGVTLSFVQHTLAIRESYVLENTRER
jgi:hypothetical protein